MDEVHGGPDQHEDTDDDDEEENDDERDGGTAASDEGSIEAVEVHINQLVETLHGVSTHFIDLSVRSSGRPRAMSC